jgi:hypothetical protein
LTTLHLVDPPEIMRFGDNAKLEGSRTNFAPSRKKIFGK